MLCHQYFIFPKTGITAGQVSAWMKCSKPTAIEMLNKLIIDNMITRVEEVYHGNAKIFYHFPTKRTWDLWQDGAFLDAYKQHLDYYVKPYQQMLAIFNEEEFEVK